MPSDFTGQAMLNGKDCDELSALSFQPSAFSTSEASAYYRGVAGEIRAALEDKDIKQAHSLVYNLKGLAGNLEATDLLAAAVELENLVKGDQEQTPSRDQLDQKLMVLGIVLN